MMTYKGYYGVVQYDDEAKIFHDFRKGGSFVTKRTSSCLSLKVY